MTEKQLVVKKEMIEKEIDDSYHFHPERCKPDFHKKHPNCVDKPMCLGALGEEVLYDVVNELSVVANNATSMIRGKDKPIGLVNAHNTCYLNVLLHCLYAIWPFRSRLMSINVKDTSSLLYVLQKTFGYMTLSKCLSFYPDELIRVLGIDPDIQCDVHEFFHGFIADLKQAILSANPDYQLENIDSLFTGKRLQCRCCLECHKVFYTQEIFSFLDCLVVNSPRLEDALQVLFAKEKMVGSEQYFCSSCAKKCDAEVLSKVKVLPPVLMIRMQRLQFDRGSGNQMKLRNGVQIPLTLDFSDFSNLDESVSVSDYVLVGVIHHLGDHASCGHYTCHLQSKNKQWYNVNDNQVEEISCPYVDVKAHPWRPCKQPNLMFSVAPSDYIDVSKKENEDNEHGEIDDENKQLESMPFLVKQTTPILKKKQAVKRYRCSLYSSKRLKGGSSRFRRMVTNNVSNQSAYMCFYLRRDTYEQMMEEEENQREEVCHCLTEEDLMKIDSENVIVEQSIKSEYEEYIHLYKQLSSRASFLEKALAEPEKQPEKCIFVDKTSLMEWLSGRDLIRKSLKSLEQSQKANNPDVKKEPPFDEAQDAVVPQEKPPVELQAVPVEEPSTPVEKPSAPVEMLSTPVEEPSTPVEELSTPVIVPSTPVKDQYKEVGDDDTVVFGSEPITKTEECLEYLKSLFTQNTPSIKEEEGEESHPVEESSICPHGRIDPLFFRYHYKGISEVMANQMKEDIGESVVAYKYTECFCDECSTRYGEFLKEVVRNQLNLTAIADKIDQHAFKRSSKTREGTVLKDRMFEDDEHCLISSTFFTKLKLQLRARRRLLGCPQRCDLPLYLHCSEELDPTNYILCSHNCIRQQIRRIDMIIIPEELWNEIIEFYPGSVRAPCNIPLCKQCKRIKMQRETKRSETRVDVKTDSIKPIPRKRQLDEFSFEEDQEDDTSTKRRNESKKTDNSSVSKEKLKVTVIMKTPKITIKCSSQALSEAPTADKQDLEDKQKSPQEKEVVRVFDKQDLEDKQKSPQEKEVVRVFDKQDLEDTQKSPQEKEVVRVFDKQDLEDKQKSPQKVKVVCVPDKEEMEDINSTHPRCFELYQQIQGGHFSPDEFYQKDLTTDEHKVSLLQSSIIQSLRERTIPLSTFYYDGHPNIKEGCYFMIDSTWFSRWRKWLNGEGVTYDEVKDMSYSPICKHKQFVIPGYMNHFIVGVSPIPCLSVKSQKFVEIVNEVELKILLKHHTLSNVVGFYYGMTDLKVNELIYFPGLCQKCQKEENRRYERQLRGEGKQYIYVKQSGILSVEEEREVLLSGDKNVILTRLSPSVSIDDWKQAIGKILGIAPSSFDLFTRDNEMIEVNTIRSYGINPETMVYLKKH